MSKDAYRLLENFPSQLGLGPELHKQLQDNLAREAAQINQSQWEQAAMRARAGMQPPAPSTAEEIATRARELFINRLIGAKGDGYRQQGTNDFVTTHFYNDRVYLFYMFNGKEGVISEEVHIFPSDGLIAQFRMILSG